MGLEQPFVVGGGVRQEFQSDSLAEGEIVRHHPEWFRADGVAVTQSG